MSAPATPGRFTKTNSVPKGLPREQEKTTPITTNITINDAANATANDAANATANVIVKVTEKTNNKSTKNVNEENSERTSIESNSTNHDNIHEGAIIEFGKYGMKRKGVEDRESLDSLHFTLKDISPFKLTDYNFIADCPTAAKFICDYSPIKLPAVSPYKHHDNKKQKFTAIDQEMTDVTRGHFA